MSLVNIYTFQQKRRKEGIMKKFLLIPVISTSILLAGCFGGGGDPQEVDTSQNQNTEQSNGNGQEANGDNISLNFESVEEMTAYLEEQVKQNKAQEAEIEYYRAYIQDLLDSFKPSEKEKAMEKEWSYGIYINNISISDTPLVQISDHNFTITLKEERVKYSVLTEEESASARLSSAIDSSVFIEANGIDYFPEAIIEETDTTRIIKYEFENFPKRGNVQLSITNELQERLGLQNNSMTIQVSK